VHVTTEGMEAGAAAIACIVGGTIEFAFALIVGFQPMFLRLGAAVAVAPVAMGAKVVSIHAALRFRQLLHERCRFRGFVLGPLPADGGRSASTSSRSAPVHFSDGELLTWCSLSLEARIRCTRVDTIWPPRGSCLLSPLFHRAQRRRSCA
jgi:hypothetical protein